MKSLVVDTRARKEETPKKERWSGRNDGLSTRFVRFLTYRGFLAGNRLQTTIDHTFIGTLEGRPYPIESTLRVQRKGLPLFGVLREN